VRTFTRGALRRSVQLRSALLFLAAAMSLTSPAAAQAGGRYEEGIVEVIAERLPALPLIVLVDSAGSVLLPVEDVTNYLGLLTRWDGSLFIVPRPGGGTAQIDVATTTVSVGRTQVQLAPAEIARPGPLYLRAERLAFLLEAEIQVDFASLTVVLARDVMFPAQQRIVAEQRRAVVLARQRQIEDRQYLAAAPYAPVTGAGILDWRLATYGLDPTQLTTLRTHAGAALFGGGLTGGASFELGSDAVDHVRDETLRFQRVFPQGRYVRQVAAGDVVTSGLFARFIRGAEISNRPFLRSPELSTVLVQPDLPEGWEYEVFQGNQLLGYSDVASLDPVAVPLRAGTTPVQVRMYGPGGEEVVTTLLYQTPVSLLRQDALEYSIGAGACASSCDEFAHTDVRYGIHPLLTAGGGLELFRDSIGSRIRPYFVYSMATGVRATAELTFMPFELYAANISLFPRDGSRATLRSSMSRPGLGPISLISSDRMRWDAELLWDERIDRPASPFSQVRLGASAAGQTGDVDRLRLSSMASFRRGFLEARYDRDNTVARANLFSGRAAIYLPFSIGTRTLRPLVNAAVGIGALGVRLAEAGVSVQPRSNAVVTASAQWSRGASRPALSIGYTARTGSVQSSLRAISSPGGVASSAFIVSGSTAFARDGSVTFDASGRTGYAGLHGTVFIDHDGDGLLSDGDEPVPDVQLIIGSMRTATDESGRFRVWGMQPYVPLPVAVDSARTPDPSLTTSRSDLVVRPAPNTARRYDVALVRTRELIGTLIADADGPIVSGISLDILNVDTGAPLSAVTFSDGLFYVSRMRPGNYRLSVSAASLSAIGAAAEPPALDFTVPAAGDELLVELPPIRLDRR
jgi:hypothetical protein